jgi:ribA/ribD-fused uncharacterized protein
MYPDSIVQFHGEYRWLSNFEPCMVVFENFAYPSVEHAYVAAKTLDPEIRLQILRCPTPGKVKRLGRQITLREDWEYVRVPLMENFLRQKFCNHPELTKKLMDTGHRELIEGNSWGDTFWGVCNGKGQNILGKLLMKIRHEVAFREDLHGLNTEHRIR